MFKKRRSAVHDRLNELAEKESLSEENASTSQEDNLPEENLPNDDLPEENSPKMQNADLDTIRDELEQVLIKLRVSEDRQKLCEEKIVNLNDSLSKFQITETHVEHHDCFRHW